MTDEDLERIGKFFDNRLKKITDELEEIKKDLKQLKRDYYIQTSPYACIDGEGHDYPNPWFSTIPPNCRKCGKQGTMFNVVTNFTVPSVIFENADGKTFRLPDGRSSDAAGYDFNQFGGNLMFNQLPLDFNNKLNIDNTNPMIELDNTKPMIDLDSTNNFTTTTP